MIIGTHFFSGILKNRCFDESSGKILSEKITCGYRKCPEGYFCGKSLRNPNENTMSFDSFEDSFLQVFQLLTLNNWANIMYSVQRAYSSWAWIYFFSLVLIGNFLFLNIVIAVLKVKYTEITSSSSEKINSSKKRKTYSLKLLKENNSFPNIVGSMEKSLSLLKKKTGLLDPGSPARNPKRFSIFNEFFLFDKNPFSKLETRRHSTVLIKPGKSTSFSAILDRENQIIFQKYHRNSAVETVFTFLRSLFGYIKSLVSKPKSTQDLVESLTGKFLEVNVRSDIDYSAFSLTDVLPSM